MALKRIPAAFYRSGNGVEPVRDWLKALPEADRRIVGFDIAAVEFGWPVGMPLCRPLGGGLWEVRCTLTRGRSPRDLLLRAGPHGAAPRLREEDAENAADRFGHRPQATKGDRAMTKKRIGLSFDSFLKDEGIYEEATARAVKRVLAWQIEQAMAEQGISKSKMAKRMKTSRAQLDRLLDPENDKVQLDTVQRAAAAVGRRLRVELA